MECNNYVRLAFSYVKLIVRYYICKAFRKTTNILTDFICIELNKALFCLYKTCRYKELFTR